MVIDLTQGGGVVRPRDRQCRVSTAMGGEADPERRKTRHDAARHQVESDDRRAEGIADQRNAMAVNVNRPS